MSKKTTAVSLTRVTPTDDSQSHGHQRVIEDFGQLYAGYGMAPTFGRVFALLLINDKPLSLDDIAAQLGVSKTQASVATRELERAGGAVRLATRGSRRVLYEASEDFESIFQAQIDRVRAGLEKLRRAEKLLVPGPGKERLNTMKELHEFWLDKTQSLLVEWRSKRPKGH